MADELQDEGADAGMTPEQQAQDAAEDAAFNDAVGANETPPTSEAAAATAAADADADAATADGKGGAKPAAARSAAAAPATPGSVTPPTPKDELAKRIAERDREARETTVTRAAEAILAKEQAAQADSTGEEKPDAVADAVLKAVGATSIRDAGEEGSDPIKTVAEFARAYPSAFDAMVAVSRSVARQIAQESVAPIAGTVQQQAMERAQNALFDTLAQEGHEDAREIVESDGFQAWIGEQSKAMQALADDGTAKDKALILATYKAEKGITTPAAGSAAAEVTAAARARKAKTDALHTPLRSSRRAPVESGPKEPTEEDLDEAFEEVASKPQRYNKYRRE